MGQTLTYMQDLREELGRRGFEVTVEGPSVRATATGTEPPGCPVSLTVAVECAPDPAAGGGLAWWWLWEGAAPGRWDRERLAVARNVTGVADMIAQVVAIENPPGLLA